MIDFIKRQGSSIVINVTERNGESNVRKINQKITGDPRLEFESTFQQFAEVLVKLFAIDKSILANTRVDKIQFNRNKDGEVISFNLDAVIQAGRNKMNFQTNAIKVELNGYSMMIVRMLDEIERYMNGERAQTELFECEAGHNG